MSTFTERPIINSPYLLPDKHWELDGNRMPTNRILNERRAADFITPIPKARKQDGGEQQQIINDDGYGLSSEKEDFGLAAQINKIRKEVAIWRNADPSQWKVNPETARLLEHWRSDDFEGIRPFFCQVEAVETLIWLTEVAPSQSNIGTKNLLDLLARINSEYNKTLSRTCLKLATGAGKTTVMAMVIAWQTINAVRHRQSKRFTDSFLIITPGITIKDRLRVLMPNDPDSYFKTRQLLPLDLIPDASKARIEITNYHAFKLREKVEISAGGRKLLQGNGEPMDTLETPSEMMRRVMPRLLGSKRILVINDEAHHCYREVQDFGTLIDKKVKKDKEEVQEEQENKEAARLWLTGIETVNAKIDVLNVIDLSATPYFLRGSGMPEGTLFPWTVSDFSLMDAIECGIVKLPRVPISDNIPGASNPIYRNLWEEIRTEMPKAGRSKSKTLDPNRLPGKLNTALQALYGHYEKTFDLWHERNLDVPPCFIIVCNNTSSSKLVFDYISGYKREKEDGTMDFHAAQFPLFSNFDEHSELLAAPHTLLIDSQQLESDGALDPKFRELNADQIEKFKQAIIMRGSNHAEAEKLANDDATLLREVMNTVGKKGELGESIRCVVSVSMLTEGWDANTVTHILGLRAFGTQLLCEQVVGRALRRRSYLLNDERHFDTEYADVLGIPFDFNAKPAIASVPEPPDNVRVYAMPEREQLAIAFPRVLGYRVELPKAELRASYTAESELVLTPDLVGPTQTTNAGIIGEELELNLDHLNETRLKTIVFNLTQNLIERHWPNEDGPNYYLFNQIKTIVEHWLENFLVCKGHTFPAMLLIPQLGDLACERIAAAITRHHESTQESIRPLLDPYNPTGTTEHVNFITSKTLRWQTNPLKSHINLVILDSHWEAEFCRIIEKQERVLSYVKNHSLGFEVPYVMEGKYRRYRPDFIVKVDDGMGPDDPLHLVIEIKGYRGEDAKSKRDTMNTYWIPAVNNAKKFGRWAFIEFRDVYSMQEEVSESVQAELVFELDAALISLNESPDA